MHQLVGNDVGNDVTYLYLEFQNIVIVTSEKHQKLQVRLQATNMDYSIRILTAQINLIQPIITCHL